MVGALLLRGMLVGVLAGVLCFVFLKLVGEPSVDRAIAFESQLEAAKAHAPGAPVMAPEPELVSRHVQAGIGLFTGVVVYSAALGGLFALAFAFAHGRIAALGPRGTAALVAALGFVAIYAVPTLKYPANPPSVGEPDTIGLRTGLYFAMIAASLAAMIGAGMLRRRLEPQHGAWNALLIAGGVYLALVIALGLGLPTIDEVPAQFPADVLWNFRMAAFGSQLILWATLGLLFGALTERARVATGRWRHRLPAL